MLNSADLAIPDGMVIVWGSRLLRKPIPGTVGGRLVIPAFCEVAARKGYRIFLLGGDTAVVEEAKRRLETRFVGLQIVGTHHGYFEEAQEQEVVDAVLVAAPDLLVLGLGTPKQEYCLQR